MLFTVHGNGLSYAKPFNALSKMPLEPEVNPHIDSITEYAELANRTLAPAVRIHWKDIVLNASTGLASETGEVNEIIKKHFFHGHPLDQDMRDHMKKELGDVIWYWALMCFAFGFDPANVLGTNIAKLKARYPEGFETTRSITRAEGDI